MISIPLTQGFIMWCDDVDAQEALNSNWCAHRMGRGVYAQTKRAGKCRYFHSAVLNAPRGKQVDHVRGTIHPQFPKVVDNRRDNLRFASRQENRMGFMEKKRGATSRFRGVAFHKRDQVWAATIHVSGKNVHLGNFSSEEDAARAYDAAALKHFGQFAQLNFPK